MRSRQLARSGVLTLVLAGCALENPSIVLAPDGGFRTEDVHPVDVPMVDVGKDAVVDQDVGGRDTGGGEDILDAGVANDVAMDVGEDTGPVDTGPRDTGPVDTGPMDTGPVDTGPRDTGPMDTGPSDTGPMDSGPLDTGPLDTGPVDTGPLDTGPMDTGPRDTGVDVPVIVDVGPPDTGPTQVMSPTNRCTTTGTGPINGVGRYLLTGNTSGGGNDHRASCNGDTDASPDVGFLVTLTAASRLTWSARPSGSSSFVPVVYLTQSCSEQESGDHRFTNEVACVDNGGAPMLTRGGVVDLPAGNYYLVVDGYRSGTTTNAGTFEVSLDVDARENSPSYRVEAVGTRSCSTIPGGAVVINDGDDVVSSVRTLPFTFRYFGASLTRLAVYTNGFFTFLSDTGSPWSAGTSWRNHSITFNGPPAGAVAPFWDDLVATSGGSSEVHQWVDGSAPGRVAHVYWEGVSFYWDSGTSISFEAKLFETSNVIEFAYCGENRNNAFSRGGSATVGFESLDQASGVLVGLNRNGAVAPSTGYRFTPQ